MLNAEMIKILEEHNSTVSDLEFSRDDQLLASSSFDGTAKIWPMAYLNDQPIDLDDHGHGIGSRKWVWIIQNICN